MAIDGGVNRRLTTQERKTLREAVWCKRRVGRPTSTGTLSLSLSLGRPLASPGFTHARSPATADCAGGP